jgi:hypothetical protein
VDYHRDSIYPVAARLFRSENQSKLPGNRQLDSRSDRYRRHTRHLAPPWGDVNPSLSDDQTVSVEADDGFISPNREAICHPVLKPGSLDRWMVFSLARSGDQLHRKGELHEEM